MSKNTQKRAARKRRQQEKRREHDLRRRQLEMTAEKHLDALEKAIPDGNVNNWNRFPDLEILGLAIHSVTQTFDTTSWPQHMTHLHPKTRSLIGASLRDNETDSDLTIALNCHLFGASAWAGSGFPTLRTTEATAAAMALTEAPWKGQPFPWKAVRIMAPENVFFNGLEPEEYYSSFLIYSESTDKGTRVLGIYPDNVAIPLLIDKKNLLINEPNGRLVRNFIGSMIQTIESGHYEASPIRNPSQRWRAPGLAPECLDFVVSSPVQVRHNLSGIVQKISRGKSPFGKFQWLVRGHWRDQAWGPGQELRRRMWIAPYWKGPTDAPILKRDYYIQDQGKATVT